MVSDLGGIVDDIMGLLNAEGLLGTVDDGGLSRRYRVMLRNTLCSAVREGRVVTEYDRGEIVAMSHWSRPDASGAAEWIGMITRSTHRGRGYATLLMNDLLDRCRERGIKKLISYSPADDGVSASMHRFFGYELVETLRRREAEVLKWERDVGASFDRRPEDCRYT
ncbi:MAG: GNAT family N-acetyltransferase [Actinobacteria bacterium]|nr:GNAT family N-acetyltransferase [Actinomycetota bacterium]